MRQPKGARLAATVAFVLLQACSDTADEPSARPPQLSAPPAAAVPATQPTPSPTEPPQTALSAPTATPDPVPIAQPTAVPIPESVFSRRRPPTPPAGLQTGGILRIVPQMSLTSLDAQADSSIATAQVARHTQEGLFQLDADFNPQPMLVDFWTASDNLLEWRFFLRQGLEFHDGQRVLAADVVGSFSRVEDGAELWGRLTSDADATMEADGDGAVVVSLGEPSAMVLAAIQTAQSHAPYITPPEQYSLPATDHAEWAIGTGPFRLTSWTPGVGWTAERWDDYRARLEPPSGLAGAHEVYVDGIEWVEVADAAARLAALLVNQVQILDEFDPRSADQVDGRPGIRVVQNNTGYGMAVVVNHLHPPFDDLQARRTLQLAYPAEEALRAAVGEQEHWSICPNYLACDTRWDTDAGSSGAYAVVDSEAAQSLVRQGGYEGTTVRVLQPIEDPVLSRLAATTAEVLEAIAFEPQLESMDWPTLVGRRPDQEAWEVLIGRDGPRRLLGPLATQSLHKDGWFNGYQDTTGRMTVLMNDMAGADSPAEQFRVWEKVNALAFEDIPTIRIGDYYPALASTTAVKGWTAAPYLVLWGTWLER